MYDIATAKVIRGQFIKLHTIIVKNEDKTNKNEKQFKFWEFGNQTWQFSQIKWLRGEKSDDDGAHNNTIFNVYLNKIKKK